MASRMRWRVATYNVLSPSLCSPAYFNKCKPSDLEPVTRLRSLLDDKLEAEVARRSIICLQEVSHAWEGELHVYFAQRQYTYVHDSYGHSFNGYMGVGIAYPHDQYNLLESKIQRIADTKKGGYGDVGENRGPRGGASWASRVLSSLAFFFRVLTLRQGRAKEAASPAEALWADVKRRQNTMVFLRLAEKSAADSEVPRSSQQSFCVATYHMPCAFRTPAVIAVHGSLLAKRLHKLAKSDPFVLGADLNLKPDSECYELLTQGSFQSAESEATGLPPGPPYEGDKWRIDFDGPLRSAYAEANAGQEPEFTNRARVRGADETFCATLDYLFFHDGVGSGRRVAVVAADALPPMDDFADVDSFPIKGEPSDHMKLSAEFESVAIKK